MIEVFLHSFSQDTDIERYREASHHPFCSQGSYEKLLSQTIKFKGRILPQEDMTVLEQITQIAKETEEELKIYDVSRFADKIKAIKCGVRKTPVAIINGKKYEGSTQISQAILNLLPKP